MKALEECTLCPRNCRVNRLHGEKGFCNAGKMPRVARANLHMWEEPCISGIEGSGTVFFSNCNLKCVFCQNHDISYAGVGNDMTIDRLAEIFLMLQENKANNINLVTPTPYVPQSIEAIKIAKKKGLSIPIIYNTGSYENIETIKALKGYVDVYLPDLKYYDDKYAVRYSMAPNYFKYASKAIEEMLRQVGNVEFDENGIIKRGVIIRHLMLPGLLFDSKKIVDYVYNTFGDLVYMSIMNQYTPMHQAYKYEEINRPINKNHYERFIDYCSQKGIVNAFIQGDGTCSEDFIPDFNVSFDKEDY